MAVMTRFGEPVKIVSGFISKGYVTWENQNGEVRHGYVWDLRATDGLKEINDAIVEANGGVEDNPEDDFDYSKKK